MPNLYTQIDNNKKDTLIIIALFLAFVTFIGWFVGEVFYNGSGMTFVALALIFSGVSSFISYYESDKIVLAISGAREVTKKDNDQLHDLVENMSIASGIQKPRIYVIDDTAMNAFATGRDPQHSVICFTTGILQSLDKRELEGVIAHEMSHIGNYDIRLMSIVTVLVGTITLLADWFTRGVFYGRRGGRKSEANTAMLAIGLVLLAISPIIATLIKLAISRNREYLADATAAMITRYPAGLANALEKLARDQEILEAANGATAHLYIVSPITGSNGPNFLTKLFQTHPPIEDRIARLEAM